MLKKNLWMLGFFLVETILMTGTISSASLTAEAVARKNNEVQKLLDASISAKLVLINAQGQTRVREIRMFTKLQEDGINAKSLIKFLAPAEVKGTGLLTHEHSQADDDIWLYLPAMKKNRRIIGADKSGSFMGTEFSYSDVNARRVADYNYAFQPSPDPRFYIVVSTPKTTKVKEQTGYSKIVSWINKTNYMDAKSVMYDTQGLLLKTMIASNIKQVDLVHHKWLPLKREMKNHQTKKSSVYEITEIKVNTGLSNKYFTLPYLER
jgi:hypothetical protein